MHLLLHTSIHEVDVQPQMLTLTSCRNLLLDVVEMGLTLEGFFNCILPTGLVLLGPFRVLVCNWFGLLPLTKSGDDLMLNTLQYSDVVLPMNYTQVTKHILIPLNFSWMF